MGHLPQDTNKSGSPRGLEASGQGCLDVAGFRRRKRNEAPLVSRGAGPGCAPCLQLGELGKDQRKELHGRRKAPHRQKLWLVVTSTIPVPLLEKIGASYISNQL